MSRSIRFLNQSVICIHLNETDIDEDEVDGVFTFDLQNVELN